MSTALTVRSLLRDEFLNGAVWGRIRFCFDKNVNESRLSFGRDHKVVLKQRYAIACCLHPREMIDHFMTIDPLAPISYTARFVIDMMSGKPERCEKATLQCLAASPETAMLGPGRVERWRDKLVGNSLAVSGVSAFVPG